MKRFDLHWKCAERAKSSSEPRAKAQLTWTNRINKKPKWRAPPPTASKVLSIVPPFGPIFFNSLRPFRELWVSFLPSLNGNFLHYSKLRRSWLSKKHVFRRRSERSDRHKKSLKKHRKWKLLRKFNNEKGSELALVTYCAISLGWKVFVCLEVCPLKLNSSWV